MAWIFAKLPPWQAHPLPTAKTRCSPQSMPLVATGWQRLSQPEADSDAGGLHYCESFRRSASSAGGYFSASSTAVAGILACSWRASWRAAAAAVLDLMAAEGIRALRYGPGKPGPKRCLGQCRRPRPLGLACRQRWPHWRCGCPLPFGTAHSRPRNCWARPDPEGTLRAGRISCLRCPSALLPLRLDAVSSAECSMWPAAMAAPHRGHAGPPRSGCWGLPARAHPASWEVGPAPAQLGVIARTAGRWVGGWSLLPEFQ